MENAPPSINPWLWVLVPVLFFTVFPAFWCFVVWIISHASGWQRLAKVYRTKLDMEGRIYTGQVGMIGWASYKGVLSLGIAEAGLFMEVAWPFRIGQPRLFIPWVDFYNVAPGFSMWGHRIKMEVGSPKIVTLNLPAGAFEGTPLALPT